MNKYKKFSIIVLSLLLFVFSACPIFATEGLTFANSYWYNGNGYYFLKRPNFIDNVLKGSNESNKNDYIKLYNESSCAFGYDNGKYFTYDPTGTDYAMCTSNLKYNHFFFALKNNSYTDLTFNYTDDNYNNAIKSLNALNFKYTVDETNKKITYSSPYLEEGIADIAFGSDYPYIETVTDSNKVTHSYLRGNGYYTFGKKYSFILFYQLNLYGDIEPVVNKPTSSINFWSDGSNLSPKIVSGRLMCNVGNDSQQFTNKSVSSIMGFTGFNWDLTSKNNSGRYGLNVAVLLGFLPASNMGSKPTNLYNVFNDYNDGIEKFYSNGKANIGGLSVPFLDFGMSTYFKFLNNEETPLPLIESQRIYTTHTYYNNKNNFYWWGKLNYNPDDNTGTEQNPDDSTPDNPSGGGSGGGSGSGGDGNITIDTQNIENLLQQILEALQNQGTTEVDLTEIENLLNAIKNNLKDYTGDISTINNTLTLINQFLNNNIDVPISDLKNLLTDIKNLSEYQKEQLTGISAVLHDMKQLFIDIYNRLGEIKDKIGGTINNIEEGTNLWDVLKALIDNLGEFLSSGLELFEKLLVPQGTFQTDFNSTIVGIQDKLGVLYQPVDVFSNFLTNLYVPTETSTLADSGHVIKIPEAKYDGVTIIEAQSIDLDETVEKSGLKPLYDVYLLIVDMIVLFGILNLAFKKFHDIISENGGDYK